MRKWVWRMTNSAPDHVLINDPKKLFRKKLYVTIPQWSETIPSMSNLSSDHNNAKCGLALNDPIDWFKLRLNQPKIKQLDTSIVLKLQQRKQIWKELIIGWMLLILLHSRLLLLLINYEISTHLCEGSWWLVPFLTSKSGVPFWIHQFQGKCDLAWFWIVLFSGDPEIALGDISKVLTGFNILF